MYPLSCYQMYATVLQPPRRLKNKNCFSTFSFHLFIRTIAQVKIYGINLTLTVAMVTKLATKIG